MKASRFYGKEGELAFHPIWWSWKANGNTLQFPSKKCQNYLTTKLSYSCSTLSKCGLPIGDIKFDWRNLATRSSWQRSAFQMVIVALCQGCSLHMFELYMLSSMFCLKIRFINFENVHKCKLCANEVLIFCI